MNYTLKELLDIPRLQELLDSFNDVRSLPSAIIDTENNILSATAWQDICTKFHLQNPVTEKKCVECLKHIGARLDALESHIIYRCPLGLIDSATPIIIEGKHLGNVFTGQLFTAPPDEFNFINQARQYGFAEDDYLAALRKVPLIPAEQLPKHLNFIGKLAQMLAEQGLQALRQQEVLEATWKSEERHRNISERKRVGAYRRMGQEILLLLNDMGSQEQALQRVIGLVKATTGVDAVGIRLQNGDDFPYSYQEGFPQDFLQKENSLLSRMRDGGICRDNCGNVCLECTCGLVITGKIDPANPNFTRGGSAWTNDSCPSLPLPTPVDLRTNPRDECIHQGFASVALIPIRAKGRIVGLLQLNGYKKGIFNPGGIEALEDIAENIGEAMLRKQAEENLIANERFLRTLTDHLPGMVGYWTAELHCSFANNAYREWFGKTPEEMLGMTKQELLGEELFRQKEPYLRRVLQGEPQHFEQTLAKANGETIFTWAHFIPDLVNGKARGFFLLVSDVTELKRAEEEKNKLETQLLQAQKIESIGRLAGGVAHDFNNMLSVILGHAEMALMRMDPGQPIYSSIQEISKAAERSAALTRQLLAFARKQTISPKVVDLNESVAGMFNMLQRLIGENIHLTWRPAPHLWPVMMDISQIDQIMANLCVNSRDAIADIGEMIIETGNCSIDAKYCIAHPYVLPGDYVKIAVNDNGVGMDKETLEHIFEPFFTTKVLGEGTGLGLATVYGIVRQNNGFVNVYSEPGKGATFTIYLPRYAGDAEPTRKGAAADSFHRGHETILLVEDEPMILEMTTMLLTELGYTVLKASTPNEGILCAQEHSGEIHLLMTDVIMPGMNGRKLARNISSLYPQIKCLFMSGYTADIIAHHGVLEDGVHFIQKPFQLNVLADKLRELLES